MVRRFISLFHKEIGGVHNAAYILGLFALFSQLLALVRDRMLASIIGPGPTLDAYFAAFRIPDVIYALLASLMSVSVLIPFLSQREGDPKKEKSLMDSAFSSFFIMIVIVSAIAWLCTPWLVSLFVRSGGTGIVAESPDLIISLTRIILLQPIFLGISNLFASITQSRRRFFLYSLSPLIYNVSIISSILFLAPKYGITGVAWGVVGGALLHFLIQIPFVFEQGMLPRFTFNIDWGLIKKIVAVSLPRTLALSATMLELVFITLYATGMKTGSLSIFNLSLNLQSVPLAIVGVSYSLAAFPTLSKLFTQGLKEKFIEHIVVPAKHIIFWSLPIAALFIVLRAHIVRVILGAGNFNWDDTRLVAASLALFVISLVAQNLELLFIRGYYATGNTRKPVAINLLSSVITISAPFLLLISFNSHPGFAHFITHLLKVDGIAGAEVLMLPLGFTIGTFINCAIFMIMFEFDFRHSTKTLWPVFLRGMIAALVAGLGTYVGLWLFEGLTQGVLVTATVFKIFAQGLLSGMLGIVAGYISLRLMKSPELSVISSQISGRFIKKAVIEIKEEIKDGIESEAGKNEGENETAPTILETVEPIMDSTKAD